MSVCGHDIYCPGHGGAHDAVALGREKLLEIWKTAKPLLRSGHPAKREAGRYTDARIRAALPFLPVKEEDES